MAATYTATETYGTSPGTRTDTSYLNCLSTDTASGSDTTTNPQAAKVTIPAEGNQASYERYYQARWTGTWTSITNVKFWIQSWTPNTGCTLYGKDVGSQTYASPTVPSSTSGFTVNTGWDVVGEALAITPASAITPTTQEYSDYVSFFLWVASTASAGAVNAWTLRCQWDEA